MSFFIFVLLGFGSFDGERLCGRQVVSRAPSTLTGHRRAQCCITRNMPSTWVMVSARLVANEATKHGSCEKGLTGDHTRAWIS
jgi:hypothetical protein